MAFDLLSEDRVRRDVDEPLDRAAGSFDLAIPAQVSAAGFNAIVSAFVRHIYAYGIRLPQRLTVEQGLAEAVRILERTNENPSAGGYEVALLDVRSQGRDGLRNVLGRLTEGIRTEERRAYVDWVVLRWLTPRDWPTRCAIATLLVERFRDFLTPSLLACRPAQLVAVIPDLVMMHVGTEEELRGLRERPPLP